MASGKYEVESRKYEIWKLEIENEMTSVRYGFGDRLESDAAVAAR